MLKTVDGITQVLANPEGRAAINNLFPLKKFLSTDTALRHLRKTGPYIYIYIYIYTQIFVICMLSINSHCYILLHYYSSIIRMNLIGKCYVNCHTSVSVRDILFKHSSALMISNFSIVLGQILERFYSITS
jgi:hypothetical protein